MLTDRKAILRVVMAWERAGGPNGFLRAEHIAQELAHRDSPIEPPQELLRTLARMGDEGDLDVAVNRGDGHILGVMVKNIKQKGIDDL